MTTKSKPTIKELAATNQQLEQDLTLYRSDNIVLRQKLDTMRKDHEKAMADFKRQMELDRLKAFTQMAQQISNLGEAMARMWMYYERQG